MVAKMMEPTSSSRGASPDEHPTAEDVARYVDWRVSTDERRAIQAHLIECARCRDEMVSAQSAVAHMRRRNGLRWAIPLLAAAAIAVVVPMALRTPSDGTARLRSGRTAPASIRALAPVGDIRNAADSVRFEWTGGGVGASFILTVTDSAGNPVVERRTADTIVLLPREDLPEGPVTLLWFIDALFQDGQFAKVDVTRFRMQQ